MYFYSYTTVILSIPKLFKTRLGQIIFVLFCAVLAILQGDYFKLLHWRILFFSQKSMGHIDNFYRIVDVNPLMTLIVKIVMPENDFRAMLFSLLACRPKNHSYLKKPPVRKVYITGTILSLHSATRNYEPKLSHRQTVKPWLSKVQCNYSYKTALLQHLL